jgi:hypothetical protein
MKQQDNNSPSKANFTTKDLNTWVEKEISNNEFQKTTVKIINSLKEDTQKLVFDLKEDVNKELNELKEYTNKQMKLTRLSRIWRRKSIKVQKPWKIINLK